MLNFRLIRMEDAVKILKQSETQTLSHNLHTIKSAISAYAEAKKEKTELSGIRRHEVANALISTCKHLKIMAANGTDKEKDAALLALINLDHWYISEKSISQKLKTTMATARDGKTATTRFRTLLYDGTTTESVATTGADNRVTKALKTALRVARSAPRYQNNKLIAHKVEHILARRRHRRQWQGIKFALNIALNAIPFIAKMNVLRFVGQYVLHPVGHALRTAEHWLVSSRTKTVLTATTTAAAVVATNNRRGWFKRQWHAFSMSWQARWQRWTGQDLERPKAISVGDQTMHHT